jgi:hypothetical protein
MLALALAPVLALIVPAERRRAEQQTRDVDGGEPRDMAVLNGRVAA